MDEYPESNKLSFNKKEYSGYLPNYSLDLFYRNINKFLAE